MSEAWESSGPVPGYEARGCLRCGWLCGWGGDGGRRLWWECPECGFQWRMEDASAAGLGGWWSEDGLPARRFPWGALLVSGWEEE